MTEEMLQVASRVVASAGAFLAGTTAEFERQNSALPVVLTKL
jgi:hypothetical protein